VGRRLFSLAAITCGLFVVVAAQHMRPIAGPPLYDGVVVFDPYKWLSPPPGLDGGAQSAQQTFSGGDLQGGFGFGTPEEPPQIQLQSVFTSLAMPSGISSVTMSIEPVATPSARPPNGIVAGNVYQITITDQNGTAVKPRRDATVTLVLRGPNSVPEATIERFAGGTWTELQTTWPGVPSTFVADIGDFGEFALVAPDAWVPVGERAVSAASVQSTPTVPGQRATAAGNVGTNAALAPTPADTAASGPRLATVIGLAVSAIVLVVCMIGLFLLGKPPKPGG
jgi:hypothetical protein